MKKINILSIAFILAIVGGMFTACSDFDPKGMPQVPELRKASDLKATIDGFVVNLSWDLPAADDIEGVDLITNGVNSTAVKLEGNATTYTVIGQPMGEDYLYTVKVRYEGGYVSEGVSINVELPKVDLPEVSGLTAEVSGRTVTLDWTLPAEDGITAVRVVRNGDTAAATVIEGTPTSCVLKGQPMDTEHTYTVSVVYDEYYASEGVSVKAAIPYIEPKIGYLMTAASISALPDDDERAAAQWFSTQTNAEFIQPSQLADLDADIYPVIWVHIDRIGTPVGWQNLPSEISNDATIAALRQYSANGGSLYLSVMATQLTVPLGFVPENMAPTVYGNGTGGSGTDIWTINPYLGWDFQNGSDQGFYDRTGHAVYEGLTLEVVNDYPYPSLPILGPGLREDHNCLWDCNRYGRGNQIDVIKNFEVTTNSLVLATWGHVRDHCVAGLVEFHGDTSRGRCIANGFSAYEWNQNSGTNPYQGNLEKLTANILDCLK